MAGILTEQSLSDWDYTAEDGAVTSVRGGEGNDGGMIGRPPLLSESRLISTPFFVFLPFFFSIFPLLYPLDSDEL